MVKETLIAKMVEHLKKADQLNDKTDRLVTAYHEGMEAMAEFIQETLQKERIDKEDLSREDLPTYMGCYKLGIKSVEEKVEVFKQKLISESIPGCSITNDVQVINQLQQFLKL